MRASLASVCDGNRRSASVALTLRLARRRSRGWAFMVKPEQSWSSNSLQAHQRRAIAHIDGEDCMTDDIPGSARQGFRSVDIAGRDALAQDEGGRAFGDFYYRAMKVSRPKFFASTAVVFLAPTV